MALRRAERRGHQVALSPVPLQQRHGIRRYHHLHPPGIALLRRKCLERLDPVPSADRNVETGVTGQRGVADRRLQRSVLLQRRGRVRRASQRTAAAVCGHYPRGIRAPRGYLPVSADGSGDNKGVSA